MGALVFIMICLYLISTRISGVPLLRKILRLNGISEVEKEVDFLLWTKDNPREPDKLKVGDVFSLHLSHFKSDLPTKILIHGFEDTGTTGWVLNVRDEYSH